MSTTAVIASARGTIFECEFRLQRLVEARDRLAEKHAAAVERVEAERRAAAHADLIARRDALAGRFEGVWRDHAEPLAAFLHEVAAVDEEIGTANRLKLGLWLDRTETVARPGVSDLDQHKLVSMATRLPPWDHDAHRSGELLWPPQPQRLDPARWCRRRCGSARRPLPRRRWRPRRSRQILSERTDSRRERAAACWLGHGDERHRVESDDLLIGPLVRPVSSCHCTLRPNHWGCSHTWLDGRAASASGSRRRSTHAGMA